MSRKSYLAAKALNIPKIILIVLLDVITVASSYFIALWFRFDCKFSAIPLDFLNTYLRIILPWCVVCIIVFALFDLYNSLAVY